MRVRVRAVGVASLTVDPRRAIHLHAGLITVRGRLNIDGLGLHKIGMRLHGIIRAQYIIYKAAPDQGGRRPS